MTTSDTDASAPRTATRHLLCKVPEATLLFWVIKVLTTGMGETASDFSVHTVAPEIAVATAGIALLAAMVLQLRAERYVPWAYWFAIVMVSVFGTMVADGMRLALGVSYLESTVFFAVALAVIFAAWHRTEGTLSIHSIHTRRRELFYWATIMATFALGTAAGDMTARTLGLGYLASGVMFAVVFAIPALAHWKLGLNPIVAFWSAYVVTRPLGASFADWVGMKRQFGGLGHGTGTVTLVMTALILALVAYVAYTHEDVVPEELAEA